MFIKIKKVSEGLSITSDHALSLWGNEEKYLSEPEPDFDPPKITSVESLENPARPEWQERTGIPQPTEIEFLELPGYSVDVPEPQPVKNLDSLTPDPDLPEKVPTLESITNQLFDYWRQYEEKEVLGEAFQNELAQNYKADKEVLNEVLKSANDWIKKTDNELRRYHFKDPQNELKSIKFTRENIEDYKQKYQNRRYFVQEKNNLITTEKSRWEFDAQLFQNKLCESSKRKLDENLQRCESNSLKLQKLNQELKIQTTSQEYELINQEQLLIQAEQIDKENKKNCQDSYNAQDIKMEKYKVECENRLTYTSAHNNLLQKKIDRLKLKFHNCQKLDSIGQAFLKGLGFGIEALLEIIILPYAAFNEKSILNRLIKESQGRRLGAQKRFILFVCLFILWGCAVSFIFFQVKKELNPQRKEKRSEPLQQRLYPNNDNDFSLEGVCRPNPSFNFRGGVQTPTFESDLYVFLSVRMIIVCNKLEKELLAPIEKQLVAQERAIMISGVKQKITKTLQSLGLSTFLFVTCLDPIPAPCGPEPWASNPSLTRVIKGLGCVGFENEEYGPFSTPGPVPDTETNKEVQKLQTNVGLREKKKWKVRKSKKRVGRISDFATPEDFENAEILQSRSVTIRKVRIF